MAHRRLKAVVGAASTGGSAETVNSSQMELPAMLGTFLVVHWAFMVGAICTALMKKHWKENCKKPKLEKERKENSKQLGSKLTVETNEETIQLKNELLWQMEDTFQRSKATLVKEQEELQWKMKQFQGELDKPQEQRKSIIHDDMDSL